MLAAATGARNGELCGLEWADLDLDAGTIRFRQALTIIDPTVLSDDADGDGGAGGGGGRRELAVGPLKSAASSAILTLPPFAVQALRQHRRQQARLRLACGQPQTVTLRKVEPGRPPQPVQLDLVFRTERGTPVNPNHASRTFARLAASIGLAAHPHMLRHALASAMAANKEPASIIAAQLRHADGGALAQRVYIHQLPQTAPRLGWGDRRSVRPRSPCWAGGVGWASGGGKVEGNPTLEPDLIGGPRPRCCWSGAMWQGQDSNLCRQCRRFYRPLPLAARAPCRTEGG